MPVFRKRFIVFALMGAGSALAVACGSNGATISPTANEAGGDAESDASSTDGHTDAPSTSDSGGDATPKMEAGGNDGSSGDGAATDGEAKDGPSTDGNGSDAGDGGGGVVAHQGEATVSGAIRATSPSYVLVTTTGQAPGGNGTMSSPSYRLTGGLVGATQGN